jgi:hypothetical protein
MPIEDVISALRGFSNAYGKIASEQDPNGQHQIRVAAINRSSFAVAIIAWAVENKAMVIASAPIATAIITLIIKLIELKKASKGQTPTLLTINGDNNTVTLKVGETLILSCRAQCTKSTKQRRWMENSVK